MIEILLLLNNLNLGFTDPKNAIAFFVAPMLYALKMNPGQLITLKQQLKSLLLVHYLLLFR